MLDDIRNKSLLRPEMKDISEMPIGIFDSGVGGLTLVDEIFRQLPGEKFIYLGDTARYPYGSRSADMVRRIALQNARFLMGFGVKVLVIACNTASSLAMDVLREWISVPLVGVIKPGAKMAAKCTKNGKVGVIGTVGTISSGAYQSEIRSIDPNIEVFGKACPLFVPLAEEGWLDGDVVKKIAHEYLDEIISKGIDTLVLGCTHYPLLKETIQSVIGRDITVIDSASATVADLKEFLLSESLLRYGQEGEYRIFVTDAADRFSAVGRKFLKNRTLKVEQVQMDFFL